MEHYTYKITITGTVQGVGFRPFVYALAQRYLFHGTVSNNSAGVVIFVNVDSITLQQLLTALEYEAPLLADIQNIKCEEVAFQKFERFEILQTQEKGTIKANIPPDISTCSECEEELFDPTNRRYRYPFITCTQCGVRYSIIKNLPYDRKNTSMADFTMCKLCEEEYTNPLDRRYHAQPIGCWDCGPQMFLRHKGKNLELPQKEIVARVVKALEDGNIVAIKGVGGYHIMCDATNDVAVKELRKRKQRPKKPFAVLVRDICAAKLLADISPKEERLLTSKERPIVLLDAKANRLSSYVAPNLSRVGIFLAYTPLHLLILDGLKRPLIATSANISNEPICSNLEDMEQIEGIYDYLLDHDREILNACDDSVVMVVDDSVITLRRARGYAPSSMELPVTLEKNVLALGANQKSTVAIAFDNRVILSPHIGDLKSISSVEYYEKTIQTLGRVYKFEADLIVHDKHPEYESTKVAKRMLKEDENLRAITTQHHYAHILGVMAEKGVNEKVFGVAFDGTGYGDDGKLWGGEFLLCDYVSYERVAHLQYFKLLGGEKAIKEPKRIALSLLFELFAKDVLTIKNATTQAFSLTELKTHYIAWEKSLNTPLTSSMGRLFDGVASLLGLCHVMSYEGQSGMILEEYYDWDEKECYDITCKDGVIEILPMIDALLQEKDTKRAVSKFFNTIVEMIALIYKPYDSLPLVVSGGVFQNRILLRLVMKRFKRVIIPNRIPPNDGGIALGQAIFFGINQDSY